MDLIPGSSSGRNDPGQLHEIFGAGTPGPSRRWSARDVVAERAKRVAEAVARSASAGRSPAESTWGSWAWNTLGRTFAADSAREPPPTGATDDNTAPTGATTAGDIAPTAAAVVTDLSPARKLLNSVKAVVDSSLAPLAATLNRVMQAMSASPACPSAPDETAINTSPPLLLRSDLILEPPFDSVRIPAAGQYIATISQRYAGVRGLVPPHALSWDLRFLLWYGAYQNWPPLWLADRCWGNVDGIWGE